MLVIQDAIAKKNRVWSSIDITGLSIVSLLENYDNVIVSILNDTANTIFSLIINTLRLDKTAQFVDVATFLQLPTTIPDNILVPHITLSNRRTVYSHTLYAGGLSGQIGDHTMHPENETIDNFSPDLIITSMERTPQNVYSNHLFTVNGLIHPSVFTNEGVYIKGGNLHLRRSEGSTIGAINFTNVGTISQHPITRSNIRHYQNGDSEAKLPLVDTLLINVPSLETEGKTIFLVVGGYLLPLDGMYSVIGDSDIKIQLRDYPILERMLSASDILPDDRFVARHGAINVPDIVGDDGIRKLFDDEHTFIVALDASNVCVESEYLEKTGLPGRFLLHRSPKGILFNNDGKVSEFEWGVNGSRVELFGRTEERKPYRFMTIKEMVTVINTDRDINAPTIIDDGKFVTYYVLDL